MNNSNLDNLKIGLIGCGMMGGALVRGMTKIIDAKNIFVSDANFSKATEFASSIGGANAVKTNDEVAKNTNIIFLAVKPNYVKTVLKEITDSFTEDSVLVSMAAGVKLDFLSECISKACIKPEIIRIMPNMPATIGEAMIALTCSPDTSKDSVKIAKTLLEVAGKVEQVSESLMDCVTGISGSGPAFVFMFIEALADAAVRCGMPRAQAYIYAAQTVKGSAAMVLQDKRCPAELKDAVCSPSGTTIEGVAALEKYGFRNATIEAVTAACRKSEALGKK